MSEHREAAERALAEAQHNPIMSAEQSYTVAQIHVLLAIERRLGEMVHQLQTLTSTATVASEAT